MSTGASGSDEQISGSKIAPLESNAKANAPHDVSSRGAAGSDRAIDTARIAPLAGNRGQYQHPAPHADSQGVVGTDETVQGAKIDPLVSQARDAQAHEATRKDPGLDDEDVDATRVPPLGEVREELR